MARIGLLLLLFSLFLLGCQRQGDPTNDLLASTPGVGGLPAAITPAVEAPLDPSVPGGAGDVAGADDVAVITPVVVTDTVVVPPPPAAAPQRFSNLRFAPSGEAAPQSSFALGADEVCAIWDYQAIAPTDTIRRVWYLNDQVYVERQETWDFVKYNASGTVRDICLYDRLDGYIDGAVDGIDPGQWRVEIFLNGESQLSQGFTVGTP